MPNRILRDAALDSDRIASIDELSEILFFRLIMLADDFGRFDGRVAVIRARAFALRQQVTEKEIERRLSQLMKSGLIIRYVVENKPYIEIPRFGQRQRAEKSKFPSKCQSDDCQVSVIGQTSAHVVEGVVEDDIRAGGQAAPVVSQKRKSNGKDVEPPELPDWMPMLQWDGWIEARRKARHPPTNLALRLAIAKLEGFREQGLNVAQILAQSAMNNWSDLYEPKS